MPVIIDGEGRRTVEAAVHLSATPEEAWQAVATADGISCWFMPTTAETDQEGRPTRIITSFGPEMDAVATVTDWDPPHRFTALGEGEAEAAEGPTQVTTEWVVEAEEGDGCTVRVIHRWLADSDAWDGMFEGHAYGWATSFFRILRLYLEHFAGEPCSDLQFTAFSQGPALEAWRTVVSAFKVDEATAAFPIDPTRRTFTSAPGVPHLAGVWEPKEVREPEWLAVRERAPQVAATLEAMGGEEPELLLRLDEPAPGIATFMAMPMGDQTMLSARLFFYGPEAAQVAARAEGDWREWFAERFQGEGA